MTLKETRQLGIEFERRCQTMDPTMMLTNKIDTSDIYSFLNQFQLQYIKGLYAADGEALSTSRVSYKIQDILKPLLKHAVLDEKVDNELYDNYCDVYELPGDYFSYVRSTSKVSGTYKQVINKIVPNNMVKQDDAHKVLESFYDAHRIMRNPVVTFTQQYNGSNCIEIIHDKYTKIQSVDITYYKKPDNFNILTGTACQLPYECFEDLVSGAVDLYLRYKAGKTREESKPKQKSDNEE